MNLSKMLTREEIFHRLSSVQTQELLSLLSDEAIFQLASRYFQLTSAADFLAPVGAAAASFAPEQHARSTSSNRAKRPLNAFMAFRSYYLKLFPDVQQKTASGFLTTLWNKDPFRNKWTLIAKVYSFVRDAIGKDKVSLSYFLSLACPTMKIIDISAYLAALGWILHEEEGGLQKLVRDESAATLELESQDFPNRELELLSTLVRVGYFPDQGVDLMERMGSNQSGIMATRGTRYTLPVSYTKEKIDFINTIQTDPIQATKELLGDCYDEHVVHYLGVKSHNVQDVDSITHLPMQREYQDPRLFYNYSVSHSGVGMSGIDDPVMQLDNLPENESYDIDSPFDLDEILGLTQSEGERTAHLDPSPKRDPHDDFHHTF
ncbi:Mating-type protein MAT-1 [Tolypocladium ophioglossoides CBS 100239]|uniref:Mating-type protein MAT-1 n=1 Tax=Tolypocladium ophioglossoides (strain CBS 100239) TaxID=1163406 RepID=A0A0L0N8B2_TOLOC|nr:Mating-type protein MAT-1 [Tolypocladium ophioglossoides CBS 100239]